MASITPNIITAPTTEPVSLTEAKNHLRITGSDEDAVLTVLIGAARAYYEWRTGRTLHQTTYEVVLDEWPEDDYIPLPRATPLISITSVKYKDSGGVETTWAAANYIADTDSLVGRVALAYDIDWPSFTAYPVSPIRIRYVAGVATTSPITEVDDADKLPILLLVGGLYENRESEVVTNLSTLTQAAMQFGAEAYIEARIVDHAF